MAEVNLLYKLSKAICNCGKLKCNIENESQQVINNNPMQIMQMKTSTEVKTDFNNKVGSVISNQTEDNMMSMVVSTVYQNGCYCTSTDASAVGDIPATSTSVCKPLTETIYNSVFCPGGQLNPINAEGLVPIKSRRNCDGCQSYTVSKQKSKCMSGYVDCIMTICQVGKYEYTVTNVMNTIDEITGTILEQNTKMDIILSGYRKESK